MRLGPLASCATASLLAASPLVGQLSVAPPPARFTLDQWGTARGLPQSTVRGLALDRDGYLWVGTGHGLARFDGEAFEPFPRHEQVAPQSARALALDAEGRVVLIWPQTDVSRLEPDGRLVTVARTTGDLLFRLAIGRGDSIWVALASGVRVRSGTALVPAPGLSDGLVAEVGALRASPEGDVWVGGRTGLVWRAPSGVVTRVSGLGCPRVTDVAPEPSGGIWVATCAGVEFVPAPNAGARLVVALPGDAEGRQLLRDASRGVLWVADRAGLHRVALEQRGGEWHVAARARHSLQLEGAWPLVVTGDGEGGVWVGSTADGLRHLSPEPVSRLTWTEGLTVRAVHHLAPDGDGGLWIGACGELAHWADGRLAAAEPGVATQLRGNCPKGLLRDRQGALWVGHQGALQRLTPDGQVRDALVLEATSLPDIAPMLEDRAGRVWYATEWGEVGYFAGPDLRRVTLPRGTLPRSKVWSMIEDQGGEVWIGQEGRVTRVRDTLVTLRLAATEGVPDAPVRGLLAEADGTLWLATYGSGVARYEPTARVRVVPGGGAPAERMLSSIRLDRAGRFWLPGDAGLVIVARAALLEALATGTPPRDVARLGPAFGVPEANGGFPSSWVDSVGSRLWFATVDGAASVAMDAFPFDQAGPRIFVDEVRVDGRRVAVSDTLRVPSGAGAVELVLSTPQLGRVAGLRVRYRLDGADRAWVELGPGRLVRYAGLAPGRYHFAARVDRPGDPDGFAEQRLAVVVLPQWWETPWARVALAVSIVAGLSLLFRGLTRRMRARNAALQREIDERRRAEARAAAAASELAHVSRIATAGELATSIAHELNQPLAAVVSGAQAARRLAAAGRAADVGATLDAVVAQSNRAAEVIRSLRAFVSKHEVGHVEVAPDELVAEAVRLLGHELAGRGVTVAVEDRRQRRRRVRGNPVQLQQVLVNLLLNAGDAMSDLPAGERQVVVELCDGPPGMVRLSVRDRGRGMSAEVRERMFEPFFTTRPQGLGLGLSLGRSIVESHAGQLVAEASPQGGTVVHVVLPEVVA